jgi:putative acetyltransferase
VLLIRQIDPYEARQLIAELDDYQNALYPPESNHLDSIDDLSQPNVYMIALFLQETPVDQGIPVAIGAVKLFNDYGFDN